ncbi:unnamed protein product [Plutella xylostella]|uniref:(diamondback moth) hypothetical protein n=1 Tax=Plutella xylostella TaxID=51655 RepID=A0A8S4GAE9_PLUXY|nr:unnamed protein product [Plutella xylostella]
MFGIRKVNECASVYGWDERTTILFAMQRLQGLARVWYESLSTILHTWVEWQEKLLSAFPCDHNYGQILEEMLKRKTKFSEPIENYFYEKLALINQCDISGKRAVDCLIHGITDRTLRSSALALSCSQPDQLLQFLISNKEVQSSDHSFNRNRSWADNNSGQRNTKTVSDRLNQSRGHLFCFNCKERGHVYTDCQKPIVKCLKCNKVGHIKENCRSRPDNLAKNEPSKTLCITSSAPNSKFIKDIQVNNTSVQAFIDFGSEVTLVKQTLVANLGLDHNHLPSSMKGFGNGIVQSLGAVSLDLAVDGVEARVVCRVVDDNLLDKPILIGQSYTEQPHIIVIKDSKSLQFRKIDCEIPTCDFDTNDHELHEVRVDVDVELFGPASIRARVDPVYDGCILLSNKVIGSPTKECVISGGVYHVRGGCLDVSVCPSSHPYKMSQNFVIGRGEKVEFVQRIMIQAPGVAEAEPVSTCDRIIGEDEVRVGSSTTKEDKERLMTILHKYKHCFADNLKDLGCTDMTQMTIEINSQRPVVYRPYRLSHHERDKVQSMIG